MAKTPSSRKNKGRLLQKHIANKILEAFPELEEDDCKSTPMGVSGEDVQLSPLARKKFNYSIEAKNTEKLNIWAAIEQAESDARKSTPLVVFKRNRSKVYCCLEFDELLKLIKDCNND